MTDKLYERDMDAVVRAATCALPVMFVSDVAPGSPGVIGTCTALRHAREVVFVTAAHVVERNDPHTAIYVPLAFAGSERRCRMDRLVKPRAAAEHPDVPVDLAVMTPAAEPQFAEGESSALDVPPFAAMERVAPDAPFVIAGFPLDAPDRNYVDHSGGTLVFGKQLAFGRYEAPSCMNGLHTLAVDTAGTWGLNGFSGGPVFRLLRDGDTGPWTPAYAGVVTNGGPKIVHFIDAAYVVASLRVGTAP